MEKRNVFTESLEQELYELEKEFAEKRANLKFEHNDDPYGDNHMAELNKLEKEYAFRKDKAYIEWKEQQETSEKVMAGMVVTGLIGYGLYKLGQAVARRKMI